MTDQEFQSVFHDTKRTVLAAIGKYLASDFEHAIDDVVQETYLRAYRSIEKNALKDPQKLRSYLYTIAKNESLRMSARLIREERKRGRLACAAMPLRNEDETVLDRIQGEDLMIRVSGLPEKYAGILKMHFEGMGVREISDAFSLKAGTVKSRTSRGIRLLKKALET